MESVEEGREFKVVDGLVKKAVQNMFSRYYTARDFESRLDQVRRGLTIEAGSEIPSQSYVDSLPQMANMKEMIAKIEESDDPSAIASAMSSFSRACT